ncbi:hypothetical protein, conserved [Trypanosoma brucei gambiense DAL972]|uniref:Protein SDA1 n=1 Tax=Trypanosoma brucei gambiense (strain MHOM/CI/86/DAL972) TaxID=679716 RepID=C9ZPA8_TRYB9|nr:hypothetical protein, conserved [Trypanosoma brucei gambiense DAL972]CBH11236.1 hypothetical protein, conserved [Trypanosoma brucei gambiense DAL972]|eukprot:XP_011773523.1 hypothetical protein, conserved [Trypanosoma brucei gambiense DAL972]
MTETAFRGTLLLLQNRTRRDPEAYRDEFLTQLDHFKALTQTVATQKETNPQYVAVLNFVCHVGHCYPKECEDVAEIVLKLLQDFKGSTMTSDLRLVLVKSLALLRSKNIVSAERSFPLFFELLQERDKVLRRVILSHIVSDIRRVNMPGAKNGAAVNKKAQNFLFGVMADDDPVQARCAEMVMIDLYRRRVWADERTVEVLTQACFSRHTAIIRTALRFFLLQMPKITSMDSKNEDDDDDDPGRAISKMKQKLKIKKKTGKRERILKREVGAVKRKYNKEEKEEELLAKQHVDPIRLLRNPQQFVERLLARLQKTSERFEVRVLYLNVIARTVSEHEVVHLPLYGFLERYMEPSQLHSTQLLALSVMCTHRMVPPDALEPLVRAIANHFVSDRSSPDAITVGLNTIREICKRQPLAMNADLLKDLVEYKSQRGDKGVVMAARALIQLFRHVYPELLPGKLRTRTVDASTGEAPKPVYGKEHVYTDIPGLELLYADEGSDASSHSCCSGSSDDDDDSDGTWVTDSSDCDPDDIEGSFVDASECGSCDEEHEECPQLVAVKPSSGEPPCKVTKYENNAIGAESQPSFREDMPSQVHKPSNQDSDTPSEESGGSSELEEELEEFEEVEGESYDEEEGDDSDVEEGSEEEGDDSSFCYEEWEDEEEEADEEEDQPSQKGEKDVEGAGEWFEDVDINSTQPSQRSTVSKLSSSAARILTDEDFARIRALQKKQQQGKLLSKRKGKDAEARTKKREALIHSVSADLTAEVIEHFTEKKRTEDRQEKIARTEELRRSKSKFEARKKKKSKLNSTHVEHSKRGKLFNMTKRSRRVGAKLKSSVADRSNRNKENKKKDIKFRIRRGWKA